MVATASELEVKIPKQAGACKGTTHQVGQQRCSHHLKALKSLPGVAAIALSSRASQRLLCLPGQAFVTALHHLPWNPQTLGLAQSWTSKRPLPEGSSGSHPFHCDMAAFPGRVLKIGLGILCQPLVQGIWKKGQKG